MASDEECLYMSYFYNALVEFVYFTILYIESHDFICISTLSKHIKFFKTEVGDFLYSFSGSTLEEKLCQFLTTVQFFNVTDNKVLSSSKLGYFKDSIFEDLTISKAIDLVLRGCINVKDVCKNMNFCRVISVSQKELLHILKNSSHFSIQGNSILSLNHFHGILGFDHYLADSVIFHFQNILQYICKLPLSEISCHIEGLLSCGTSHILSIMCILYCSEHFHFENGFMSNVKPKKCQKQNYVDMSLCQIFSDTTKSIDQIVHLTQGMHIQNWTGEICCLNKGSGAIYCIIQLSNGHHGIFILHFNHAALKIISEVVNLKEYLHLRDNVQFYAKYHQDKNCWIAHRIKLLNSNRLDYDECLFNELERKSDIRRESCLKNAFHSNSAQNFRKCFHVSDTESALNENCIYNIVAKDSNSMRERTLAAENKTGIVVMLNNSEIVLNVLFNDYLVVFGYIILLMSDKGIAVFLQNNKVHKILFLKNSIYRFNKSVIWDLLYVGQKIFAVVPFIDKVDTTAAASLVYGLNDNETEKFKNPLEFSRHFLPCAFSCYKLNCTCDIISNLTNTYFYESSEMSRKLQEFHELVMSCCDSAVSVNHLSAFWSSVIKQYIDVSNDHIILLFIKFAGMVKRKLVITKNFRTKCKSTEVQSYSAKYSGKNNYTCLMNKSSMLTVNYEKHQHFNTSVKLKIENGSFSSLSSYKSFDSVRSSDTYYSCESGETSTDTALSGDGTKHQVNPTSVPCENHQSCMSSDSVQSPITPSCVSREISSVRTKIVLPGSEMDHQANPTSDSYGKHQSPSIWLDSIQPPGTSSCVPIATSRPTDTVLIDEIEHPVNPSSVSCDKISIFSPDVKNELLFVVENFEDQASKSHILNIKFKKKERLKYFRLQSIPSLKPTKRNRCYVLSAKKSNCDKTPSKVVASLSLMTDSFYFYDINIDEHNVLLPLPKKTVPPRLAQQMKLKSCFETEVLPHPVLNLSSILSIKVVNSEEVGNST